MSGKPCLWLQAMAVTLLGPCLLWASLAAGQSIFTLAGGGVDDGLPATLSTLHPQGVAVDAAGNVYIADKGHNRVRKVSVASGLISTVAGNGHPGFSGDGGLGSMASLNQPTSITFDPDGNLVIADWGNHRIRRVDARSGVISTVAGGGEYLGDGGPANQASLLEPASVVFDREGNYYITDSKHNRIRMVERGSGVIRTIAGTGAQGFSGDGGPATAATIWEPWGIALDKAGNVLFSDCGLNSRIRRVDSRTGTITTVAGIGQSGGAGPASGDGGPATAARLVRPFGIAVDTTDGLYVADEIGLLWRISFTTGVITWVGRQGAWGLPYGVAVDSTGALLVANKQGQVLIGDAPDWKPRLLAGGGITLRGDGGPARQAFLNQPTSAVRTSSGDVFIADNMNFALRRVGGQDGLISSVPDMGRPRSLAADARGSVIIGGSDAPRSWVRRLDTGTGDVTYVAGVGNTCSQGDGGPAIDARLASGGWGVPSLAVERTGDLILVDVNRVRRVTTGTGLISTVAGNGSNAYSGEGGPATAATLDSITALAIDAAGDIYLGEGGCMRRVSAGTGRITTVAGHGADPISYPDCDFRDGASALQTPIKPQCIAIDSSGQLLVASGPDGRVLKVDPARGTAAAASNAYLDPRSLAVDSAGNMYVSLSSKHTVVRVDAATGSMTTIAGDGAQGFSGDGGPATRARLNNPGTLALGPDGDLFIADTLNRRVRKLSTDTGVLTTVAGNGRSEISGDGGVATVAGIDIPRALALDAAGNLFVAGGNRIRKVTASTGTITTIAGGVTVGGWRDGEPASLSNVNPSSMLVFDTNETETTVITWVTSWHRNVGTTSGLLRMSGRPAHEASRAPDCWTARGTATPTAWNTFPAHPDVRERIRKLLPSLWTST